MVKPIEKNILFLRQKSEKASKKDRQIVKDLLDTLKAHADECVGMAANMIGESKCIIAINTGKRNMAMINPVIVSKEDEYETEESCLSLNGVRKTKRYKTIEVEYEDIDFKKKKQKFTGFTAQIIQHECDHLEGIII